MARLLSVTRCLAVCLALLAQTGLALPEDYYYYDYYYDQPIENMEPPRFNVDPLVLTPLVGETVNLPCTSDKNQSEVLIINRESFDHSKELLIIAGNHFLIKYNRYSFMNNIFTIKNVRKSDSSYYSCLYLFNGVRINVTHTLDVYFEPSIEMTEKTIEVTKGESATLECKAKGNPPPKVTWTKQHGVMFSGEPEEVGNSITIQDVDRHADGVYSCIAENGVGNPASGTRQIIVSYPPEIRTENEKVHTGSGDRVELVCVVHAFPSADVSWTRNGVPVDSDTRAEVQDGGHRHLLTVESVSEDDFGHYQCIATNVLGTATEDIYMTDAPSTPDITSDPHSAEEGSYTLTWTTDSYYPITQFKLMYRKTKANDSTDEPGQWMEVTEVPAEQDREDGTVTRNFRHTLTDLQRATDYDAVLEVRNKQQAAEEVHFTFSTRKGRLDLVVSSNQAPEALRGSTLHVHEGDRLSLTCSATGSDPRRVFWYEKTILLESTDSHHSEDRHSSTLVLDPVQAADDGRVLACRVDSSTQYKKVTLKVQKIRNRGLQMHISSNPAEALNSNDIVKVNLGSKLDLTCILKGYDLGPHRLSWWRNEEQLTTLNQKSRHSETSALTLDPVGVGDHLKALACRADGSTIARTVTLEVQGIPEDKSRKVSSILEDFQNDPLALQATGLIIALACGILLVIACVIIIKALHTYLKVSKIHEQQVKSKQQGGGSSSSSSRRGQRKTPAMRQSLKNQILASSAALLPQGSPTETGANNTDQGEADETVPISEDRAKEGQENPTFVEEV